MNPRKFSIRRGPNFDVEEYLRQYVVDFLLDGLTAWVQIRDNKDFFFSEQDRANKVTDELKLLLNSITTFPSHSLVEKIQVDTDKILYLMIEQLAFFSEANKAKALRLIEENLKQYLSKSQLAQIKRNI